MNARARWSEPLPGARRNVPATVSARYVIRELKLIPCRMQQRKLGATLQDVNLAANIRASSLRLSDADLREFRGLANATGARHA
jgi:hypothetical protein